MHGWRLTFASMRLLPRLLYLPSFRLFLGFYVHLERLIRPLDLAVECNLFRVPGFHHLASSRRGVREATMQHCIALSGSPIRQRACNSASGPSLKAIVGYQLSFNDRIWKPSSACGSGIVFIQPESDSIHCLFEAGSAVLRISHV